MTEPSHAEMQQEHYRLVRESPNYRLEGIMDVMWEEMMMRRPYRRQAKEVQPEHP